MAALIDTLIDKQDSNEIVRDQIAAILAVEVANQKVLATAAGKDPALWDFAIFIERSKPWEIQTETDGNEAGEMPLVNVSFDSDTFDNKNSNGVERQRTRGIFYVDCYGFKTRTILKTGDELSSRESDRIAKLVRNILMSAAYTYLNIRPIISRRYITRREKFAPDIRQEGFENIVATRITIEVEYDENSPQVTPVDLELIYGKCTRSDSGQIYFEIEIDTT